MGKAAPQPTVEPLTETEPKPECPECGEEITGIGTVGPGNHEYAGCGHKVNGALSIKAATRK